ncbi:MAG: UMP kinase [Promethearchaeota archaeon]
MKELRIIKIGGSLLFTGNRTIDSKKIIKFSNIFKRNENPGNHIIICGGGLIAREYIDAVRSFEGSEALCDIFGIEISHINSKLIIASLKNLAFPQVPKSFEELSKAMLFNKIIVMGGLQPGQSTTSVALEVAEFIGGKEIVILTDVPGIYDKDPKKFDDAKLLEHLTYDQLQELILKDSDKKQAAAGEYRIFDAVSLQILKRSNIKVIILSGKDLNEFKKYWNGVKNVFGTIISND